MQFSFPSLTSQTNTVLHGAAVTPSFVCVVPGGHYMYQTIYVCRVRVQHLGFAWYALGCHSTPLFL